MPYKDRHRLKIRNHAWAVALATKLSKWNVEPNHLSCLGVLFALFGGVCLLGGEYSPALLLVAAVCILGRLLCNMMDGMVAIAGDGQGQTAIGPLVGDVSNRLADVCLLVPLGYAIGHAWIGWAIALLALLTSYVRVFGVSLGQPQDFSGPMAKFHRMEALAAGCLVGTLEGWVTHTTWALALTAVVLLLGTAGTVVLRCVTLGQRLNRKSTGLPK